MEAAFELPDGFDPVVAPEVCTPGAADDVGAAVDVAEAAPDSDATSIETDCAATGLLLTEADTLEVHAEVNATTPTVHAARTHLVALAHLIFMTVLVPRELSAR